MPYIPLHRRRELSESMFMMPQSAGELNYLLTMLVQGFITERMKMTGEPLKYCMINDVMGALEGAKAEFYRRVAAPYEDKKREENGEVYFIDTGKDDK